MTDTVQVWLVERDYTDKGLVNLVYATTDGERYLRRQLSEALLMRTDVTAGRDVESDRLELTDEDMRDQYRSEASRMAEKHEPGETV